MTRANIVIKQDAFPKKVYLEIGSSAFPEDILPALMKFLVGHKETTHGHLTCYERIQTDKFQRLLSDTCATISQVGNFSFAYEVDLINGTVTAWKSGIRWINAPKNWKEKGYICWRNKEGDFGYTTWVKAKKIFYKTIDELTDHNLFHVFYSNKMHKFICS